MTGQGDERSETEKLAEGRDAAARRAATTHRLWFEHAMRAYYCECSPHRYLTREWSTSVTHVVEAILAAAPADVDGRVKARVARAGADELERQDGDPRVVLQLREAAARHDAPTSEKRVVPRDRWRRAVSAGADALTSDVRVSTAYPSSVALTVLCAAAEHLGVDVEPGSDDG